MLILFGCYWLSMWIVVPIAILHGRITSDIIYSGTLGALLMYIVAAIPVAIVAVGAGALCVYSIEGAQHRNWLFLLSLLFAVMNFTGFHWVQAPDTMGLFLQGVESIIPAISCYLGGAIVFNRLHHLRNK